MSKPPKLNFEASAYLQRLIGRELISTEELAIIELVKNAYDAGASEIVITIRPQSEREPGEIVIRDNGDGMSLQTFKRIFMFAGYSERPNEVKQTDRVPTGEKGIGRFAADKLGHELSVETKPAGAIQALKVNINWDRFETRRKKFSDIKIPYSYGPSPDLAAYESGTLVRISRLRSLWDNSHIKRLRQLLSDLLDPFNPPRRVSIELQVPGSLKLTGSIPPPPIITGADIELVFGILKDGKVKRSLKAPTLGMPGETTEILTAANSKLLVGLRGRLLYFTF